MKAQPFLPPHLLKHREAEHSAFWFRFLKGRRKDVRFTVISLLSGETFYLKGFRLWHNSQQHN